MTGPVRIQRQRTAGWRAPLGTIYVGRPTPWGNPFPVARTAGGMFPRADAVRMYRELVVDGATTFDGHQFARTDRRGPLHVPTVADIRRVLAGHDLACWCPLKDADGKPVPCHADVLLELANE
ncbi:DUF4326 domain-containing protein [Pimelobacter simplex]|uniref:Phage protein n=1 Tax=Nocardioides simplex TaxID=2045 RepID=A0A0A1DKB8_NOCSI|nr:DUF4326 domain-containing protein [Pimelobacter simplex]AIY15820.1 Phage protein [Pimelobacter simplex]MCG8150327.1 DUF4326 domain-containing protein [Pimelobacter simplex]GEB16694.1 hypothetical protein NSI01_50090 [Pimelobacter simplex]SFM89905.1 protein of unknown function [Pimelobacter simplex]